MNFVNVLAAGDKVYALGRPSATKCMLILRIVDDGHGNQIVAVDPGLGEVGSTMIIQTRDDDDGYWYLSGTAITLGQLLYHFRDRVDALVLQCYEHLSKTAARLGSFRRRCRVKPAKSEIWPTRASK